MNTFINQDLIYRIPKTLEQNQSTSHIRQDLGRRTQVELGYTFIAKGTIAAFAKQEYLGIRYENDEALNNTDVSKNTLGARCQLRIGNQKTLGLKIWEQGFLFYNKNTPRLTTLEMSFSLSV